MPTKFNRYIGIDYSGAQTPEAGLKGIRVYQADNAEIPVEIEPPPGRSKYWSRKGLALWLAQRLEEEIPTIVGLDHGFSFPIRYYETHHLQPDWDFFLKDFCSHWPTATDHTYVDFVRDGICGNGNERCGNAKWRRIAEERTGAKSVFHFDVPGSVAKSTHSGLPWLLYLRQSLGARLHFWPFDGWRIPHGRSAIAEIYPSLWSKDYPRGARTSDQHDAYVSAAWLQQTDAESNLEGFLYPDMLLGEYATAQVEGWILGVK